MKTRNEKVVIVGGGMAGLTAAAYLTKEIYDVLLLEKNDKSGGLVNTFEHNGFSFDTGPRAFINSGMVKPILKDLGLHLETVDNIISLTIADQSLRVNSMDSIHEYKKIMLNLYPNNAEDIEKIMKRIFKLSKYTKILYEFDNPYFADYMEDKKFVITKLLPWTFKLLYALKKFKKFDKPMEEYLESLTDNDSLIDILTQFFFRKTPTYFALGYFYVWLDYFYPKGGTGALPDILQKNIVEGGTTLQFNTQVAKVIPSESKIIDTAGNLYEYDYLVWAADLKTLYKQMDTNGLTDKIKKQISDQSFSVFNAKPAESSFNICIGVNRPLSYFQEISGAHAFYTPSKKGLRKINKEDKQSLLENFGEKSKANVLAWLDDFCAYNTYEVSIPALRDSTLAPKGQTGIMISCLFDYEVIKKISEAGWVDDFKKEMENRIIKIFSKSFYKDMEQDVIFSFSTTPLTINNVIGSSGGSMVGWSFETKAPVYNQLPDMPKCALTPIPNIYQAGQWAYAPAGVPVAMLTGWHASQEIIKKSKKK